MKDQHQQPVIGVDIGGSHLTAALVRNGNILPSGRARIKIDPHTAATVIFDAWAGALTEVIQNGGLTSPKIGIAMPGPFEYDSGISRIRGLNKYEALYGLNVRTEVAQRLKLPPENLIFINDAQAFLQGEVYAGAGTGFDRAIGITLGTGLGSASAIEGLIKDENRAITPYLDSFAEAYISTRWFIARFAELTGMECRDLQAIIATSGHEQQIRQVFAEFNLHLENFLTGFIADTQPQIVVIGGNIARAADRFLPGLRNNLKLKFPETELRLTKLWEDAALVGATAAFATDPKESKTYKPN
ncbi:ROK family protein [Pedobacter yulinensis]|uniref:ROK family protein n=1 Tax=Pedobacter yulinensis TaxID=2126353 RepID=A0A2T3HRN4_9SPHI|nr:ROK family protein [Pedobacter yulinensis]PST85076.1 ROK family protein [Pedobacter yulinensis]